MNLLLSKPFKHNLLIPIFVAFLYWVYLFFFSQMEITQDALGYESHARGIVQLGWQKYFNEGPGREPLYLFLISLSMHLAGILNMDYQFIQKIFQILILLLTQLLTLTYLKRINTPPSLILALLFYLGFSPAIVNSAFSLYSEILTYPLILGIVLISGRLWISLSKGSRNNILLLTLILGILSTLAVSVKAVLQYVLLFYFIILFILLIPQLLSKGKRSSLPWALALLIPIVFFSSFVYYFKITNLKTNGHFAYTTRGDWMVYATTHKRMSPMTPQRFQAFLYTILGDKVCQKYASPKECFYWSSEQDSLIGAAKSQKLRIKGVAENDINSTLYFLTKQEILQNPLRQAFFMFLEGIKLFLWESTQIGFVTYPPWLKAIFDNTLFKNSLRLFIFLLTLFSFIYLMITCIFHRKHLASNPFTSSETMTLVTFSLFFQLLFIIFYSLFTVLTRFSFPLVPLYLANISFFLQNAYFKKHLKISN